MFGLREGVTKRTEVFCTPQLPPSMPRHWPLPLLTLKIATFRVILFKLDHKDCTVSVYKDGYVGYTLPGREENFLFFIRLISLCLNPPP